MAQAELGGDGIVVGVGSSVDAAFEGDERRRGLALPTGTSRLTRRACRIAGAGAGGAVSLQESLTGGQIPMQVNPYCWSRDLILFPPARWSRGFLA